MSKQTQGSMLLVGVLSGGIAFVAFLMLMVVGEMAFSPAAFLAALVGLGVAIFLFRAFHSAPDAPKASAPAAQPAAEPAAAAPEPVAAPEPEPAPAPEPVPVPEPVAATHSTEGPARLDGPRDGGADDLKKIKGVGPKLEAMLHRMGFYHYEQVASWTPEEVEWVDENLEGFKGRVSRDDWVSQAATLAAGGETEFSQKVDKGDVY